MIDLPDIPVNSDWEHRRHVNTDDNDEKSPDTQRSA